MTDRQDDVADDGAAGNVPEKHAGKSDAWRRGYAARSRALGQPYVDNALDNADDLTLDLQDYLTEHAWGASWARPGLDFRTRSMLNLSMLTALNRPHELEVHLRAALRNGVTRDEIKEIFLHTAVYCGAPAALDSFRVARKVLAETPAE
jgi:4-carboxymuconolactone decarboxylase